MSYKFNCYIPEACNLIANPVLEYYTLIKQIKRRWVYNQTLNKSILIFSHKFSAPIFLPELGCLLSFDITSGNIASEFYELREIFDGFKSDNKIITTKLFNYDPTINRAVSRGYYKLHTIKSNLYEIYLKNLETEISLTPSISYKGMSFSPTRWFLLKSDDPHYLRTTMNYNYNLVYLENDAFKSIKKEKIWIDKIYNFYSLKASFVKFKADGWTSVDRTKLFFSENPESLKQYISGRGEYFICFLISLNDYSTSYPINFRDRNINIVEAIDPIVYSACDIVPFLFPFYLREDYLNDLFYRINIPKKYIFSIIRRMNKFGNEQDYDLIEGYKDYKNKSNYFMRFFEEEDYYYVLSINPSLYPFMLKNYLCENRILEKMYLEEVSKSPENLLSKLQEYNANKDSYNEFKILLKKYITSSSFRRQNYTGYMNVYDYCSNHEI
ncbi:MAG: hypothetical protein ACTSQY_04340 [Candidatus Odinarchaeia archaeon]